MFASLVLTALPARAASEGTDALQVCGTLRAHTAATATAEGSLRIGSRTYPVASRVIAGNGGVEVTVGRDLCVTASIGLTSGRLVRYLLFPMLSGDRVCGNIVRPASPDNFAMRADFGELTLLRGTPTLAIDNPGMRACYAYRVDGTSGDLVATEKMPVRDTFSDRERVTKCGTVKGYVPATAAASGQITVGSRSFRIAAGTAYTGDPAGDRTDRTTVGQAMCLVSTLDTGGAIVEYLTRAMQTSIAATASAYTPPSGSTPGIAILSLWVPLRAADPGCAGCHARRRAHHLLLLHHCRRQRRHDRQRRRHLSYRWGRWCCGNVGPHRRDGDPVSSADGIAVFSADSLSDGDAKRHRRRTLIAEPVARRLPAACAGGQRAAGWGSRPRRVPRASRAHEPGAAMSALYSHAYSQRVETSRDEAG